MQRRAKWQKFLFVSILCCNVILLSQAAAQPRMVGIIAGRVLDAQTQQPLRNVNVFLTNTMLGDATDREGRFEIDNVPFGMYELTVSSIGYHAQFRQVRVNNTIRKIENFAIQPRVLDGPEVTVTAMDPASRAKFMKIFERIFLGASHEELRCSLINPQAVKLSYTDSTQLLEAFAYEPLLVENRATGYRLHFLLDAFRCEMIASQLSFTFKGRAQFIELDPVNREEREVWRRNRLIAYHGSLRHFLTALATEHLSKSGFYMYRTAEPAKKLTPFHTPKIKTGPSDILFATESPRYRKLQFQDYLEVTYNLEGEPQTSWLSLNDDYALLDTTGAIIEPFDPTNVRGVWAYESLTELLPRDFNPERSARSRPVYIADTRDYFSEGLELAGTGDWQSALRTWQVGKDIYDIQAKANPELGLSFIQLATENGAVEFYEEACRNYYWALSAENYGKHKDDLIAEVERLAPLLEEDLAEKWRREVRKGRADVLYEIKKFWVEKDPTPTTLLNERLIEHWLRIAYARKQFRKASTTPYGTDDRGLIYVKYGKPDRERALTLGAITDEMYRWGSGRENPMGNSERIQSSENVSGNQLAEREMLRKTVGKFNYFPECEVWIYRDQLEGRNAVYLFGPRDGKGAYGLRNSVEEFIPDEAFQRFRATEYKGFLPGALIQMMYYRELSALDSDFADRYAELEDAWFRAAARGDQAPNTSYIKGLRNQYKTLDTYDAQRRYAPKEQSAIEEKLNTIALTAIRARVLENNKPRLIFVGMAHPQNLTAPVAVSEQAITTVARDSMQYAVVVRNHRLEEIRSFTGMPFSAQDLSTAISIDHRPEYAHYTMALHSIGVDEVVLFANDVTQPFSTGKAHFDLAPPLDFDPSKLEVSDLIIGVQPPPDFDMSTWPFPIIPARKILRSDPMQVYFEAYHLTPDETGICHFELDFRVIKLLEKDGKLQRREVISSAFDYEAASLTAREHFGVSIANLDAGNYEVEVELKDTISNQKKQRSVIFEIIE